MTTERKAHGHNPATEKSIKIEAKTTVKFRLAKAAKDAVVPSEGLTLATDVTCSNDGYA